MEWIESNPLPAECTTCNCKDCYNCDYACKRFHLSPYDELRLRKKGILKAIERLERQLKAIDAELEAYKENGEA